ncbi:MAG: hypothetical protein ACAH83_05910 [Alphaproteobacteria bacterium]
MLSKKFKAAAGAGLLSVVVLAGCSAAPPSPDSPPAPQEEYTVVPEKCVVVDRDADRYQPENYSNIAYNFRMGAVAFNTTYSGFAYKEGMMMPMKDLAEDGQARALEMFSKLPASANCKAPKFN